MRTLPLVAVLLLLIAGCTTTNHYNTQLFESDWLDTNPGVGSTPVQAAGDGGLSDKQKAILERNLEGDPKAMERINKEFAAEREMSASTTGTASPSAGPTSAQSLAQSLKRVYEQVSGSEAKTDAEVDAAARLAASMNSPNANVDAGGDDPPDGE